MTMKADFFAAADQLVLTRHGLADFDALWHWQGEPVDTPNTGRGGVSAVYRLQLDEHAYYLKRQRGHCTRSLRAPLGEPTFAREWRNIQRYQRLGLPTLDVAFFGVRGRGQTARAILLTRALVGFDDLDSFLTNWHGWPEPMRIDIVHACGELARRVHAAGLKHGCFYPKHIFLRETVDGWQTRVIDLEKSRRLLPGQRDRIADLEPLVRRATAWGGGVREFLAAYLGSDKAVDVGPWLARLTRRQRAKERQ